MLAGGAVADITVEWRPEILLDYTPASGIDDRRFRVLLRALSLETMVEIDEMSARKTPEQDRPTARDLAWPQANRGAA
jgi:hypothetical protein